jgi:hypothetical protein
MNENEVKSAFADLCGYRDLDPVEVLNVLNAQDCHPVDEEPVYTISGLKIHEEPNEDDDYISTAGLKIHEDSGSAAVMTPSS